MRELSPALDMAIDLANDSPLGFRVLMVTEHFVRYADDVFGKTYTVPHDDFISLMIMTHKKNKDVV